MFCSKCGTRIEDNATFCSNCGEKVGVGVKPVYTAVPPVENKKPRTNPVSIISLVLSIIGLIILPLVFSTGGLLTGIVASSIATERFNGGGKKMSIWAIILGACGLAYGIIVFLINLG